QSERVGEGVEQARTPTDVRRVSLENQGRCMVLGDRDRLKQLIANLVENAIRYTPKTGRIDVTVSGAPDGSNVQQPGAAVRSRNARGTSASTDMAILTVADYGIGIAPADLSHVFERFLRVANTRSCARGGVVMGQLCAQYI